MNLSEFDAVDEFELNDDKESSDELPSIKRFNNF